MRRARDESVVDKVADTLAYRIAVGRYKPGERLPSVRRLAEEFDISRPTAQIVMSRLESIGFATVHRGLGFVVRDVRLYGGIESWRYLFRASTRLPETSTKILDGLVAAFHMILLHTLRVIAADQNGFERSAVSREIDKLELLSTDSEVKHEDLTASWLQVIRVTISSTGQFVHLALFNSIADMIVEQPEASKAMHVWGSDMQVGVLTALRTSWENGTLNAAYVDELESYFIAFRIAVVERFRELITLTNSEIDRQQDLA